MAAVDIAAVQLRVPAALDAMHAAARAAGPGATLLDPPHLSLGYPWPVTVDLDRVAHVASTSPPIVVHLDDVAVWGPEGREVVHLTVHPHGRIRDLARRLGWPDPDRLAPHVSLVRLSGHDPAPIVEAARPHVPGRVVLGQVEVDVRSDGRWRKFAVHDLAPVGDVGPP